MHLDGLRALAALAVVCCHATQQATGTIEPWAVAIASAFQGSYAVCLFIVISGYCLTMPVVHRGSAYRVATGTYLRRRARRLLPPYYCALGLSAVAATSIISEATGTHWDVSLPVEGKALVTHILLLHNLWSDTSARINHALWSVSVEWWIYFTLPLLVWLWRQLGTILTTIVAVTLSFALLISLRSTWVHVGTGGVSPHFIGLFAMGAFAAHVAHGADAAHRGLRERMPWGVIALALLAVLAWTTAAQKPGWSRQYVAGLLSMSLLTMLGTGRATWLARCLSARPLVWLGAFSYSVYLIHAPLLQVITQYGFGPWQLDATQLVVCTWILGTPLVLATAYAFHVAFERPFLNSPAVTSACPSHTFLPRPKQSD